MALINPLPRNLNQFNGKHHSSILQFSSFSFSCDSLLTLATWWCCSIDFTCTINIFALWIARINIYSFCLLSNTNIFCRCCSFERGGHRDDAIVRIRMRKGTIIGQYNTWTHACADFVESSEKELSRQCHILTCMSHISDTPAIINILRINFCLCINFIYCIHGRKNRKGPLRACIAIISNTISQTFLALS